MKKQFASIWSSLVRARTQSDRDKVLNLICNQIGALGVSWTERVFHEDPSHSSNQVSVIKNHFAIDTSSSKQKEISQAHSATELIPPFHSKMNYCGKALRNGKVLWYADMPQDERYYIDFLCSEYSNVVDINFKDSINVPLPGYNQKHHISTINIGLDSKMTDQQVDNFPIIANLFHTLWKQNSIQPTVILNEREKELIKWGIAGKTYEEISMITGVPVRTIRYYFYKIRDLYGFATIQQMLVQVSTDYDIYP